MVRLHRGGWGKFRSLANTSAVGVRDCGREVLTPVTISCGASRPRWRPTVRQTLFMQTSMKLSRMVSNRSCGSVRAASRLSLYLLGLSTRLCDVGKEVRSARESGRVGVLMFQEREKGIQSFRGCKEKRLSKGDAKRSALKSALSRCRRSQKRVQPSECRRLEAGRRAVRGC